MVPTVRAASEGDLGTVLAFYQQSGYSPAVAHDDQVFVAHIGARLVATTRISTEHGSLVLRGMRVHPDYQRQRIGTALLAFAVDATSNRPCYCLPFAHLSGFYGRAGFAVVADSDAPPFLLERALRYRGKGEEVVVMAR